MAEPPGPVLVVIPTYEERTTSVPRWPGCTRASRGGRPRRRRRSPDGTGGSPTRSPRPTSGCRCCTAAKAASARPTSPGSTRAARRAGHRRDGRRRLARPGGPARPAARDRRRGPGARVPLRAGRPGGRLARHRKLLSRSGNLYSRLALGVPIRDITGGFRVYRRTVLEELHLDDVASQGYCFQVDMAWRAIRPVSASARCRSRSPSAPGRVEDER